MTEPLSCTLSDTSVLVDGNLCISFHRTIRVPDNSKTSYLPPDLGAFPLAKISEYATKLPEDMVSKGGLFFPMYRKRHNVSLLNRNPGSN